MTTSTPRAPWDDERLAAAFAARAARAVPPVDLASSANAALRARPGSEVIWRRLIVRAAVVILAVGAVSGGIALLGAQRGSSGPGQPMDSPSANPSASPSPFDPWAGREAMGLPVISVSDAIAIRDGGVDDREIAVHGWFWPVGAIPCTLPPPQPLEPVCLDHYIVLMAEPEKLGTGGSTGYHGDEPTGPSFQIDLDDLDSAWQPALPPSQPVEIAVVGHFDDRLSTSCSAEQQNACRDRFVVDRVDLVNGSRQPTSVVDYVEGAGKPFDEAQAVIDVVRPGVTVLSATHGIGGFDPPRIEPSFFYHSLGLKQEAMWIVSVLDHGAVATYVFIDSTADLYDITRGRSELMAPALPPEPTRDPTPSWGPWPPENAFSVLEFKDDMGRKAFVAVVDESGLLEWVQEGVPDSAIGGGATDGFFRDPSGAHRYRLRWTTTICDLQMTVSIGHDVARIIVEHAPRNGCDTMAVGRELVLQFTEDVHPADVELKVIEATLLPGPPPEPTTTVVTLERSDSTESILVIDHAASLMGARAANPVPLIPDFSGVRIIRADDGGTVVLWNGTLCDRDLSISIEAHDVGHPDRIVVHGTRLEPCRMALVRRAIWLDLGPVDVASIVGQLDVGPRSDAQRDPERQARPGTSGVGRLVGDAAVGHRQ